MVPTYLFAGVVLVVLAPVGMMIVLDLPARSPWDEAAAAMGLVALAILLLEFVLSGRFRIVSRRIGLDVTIRAHQVLARAALFFIAFHPFLYSAPLPYPPPDDPLRPLGSGLTGLSLTSGVLAWLLALVLILAAIWRDKIGYRYELWRRAHGIGALLVVGLALHHAVTAGRYSGRPLLFWFWMALLSVALLSLAWVYLLRPLAQLRRPYEVASVTKIARRTWELVVRPVGAHRLVYKAGQFVWLKIGRSAFSIAENPFSISSAPASGSDIAFVVKELGDFTDMIGTVVPGTRAYIDGPHGNLTIDDGKALGLGLVAGGVGIAPMLSILRQCAAEGERRPIILIYGNRCRDQIVSEEELAALQETLSLSVVHVLGEPGPDWQGRTGMIDAACIRSVFSSGQARDWLFVLCGPPAMLETAQRELAALGAPSRNIRSERFSYD